jgi:hypothetical protein
MTAYHAIHESPYDDACPDCTGFAEAVEVAARPRQRWALVLAIAGIAAIVLLLGGTRV